jgi:hypothetical protein
MTTNRIGPFNIDGLLRQKASEYSYFNEKGPTRIAKILAGADKAVVWVLLSNC